MVGWCVRGLAHWPGLNCVLHGGRVPRQNVGLEPQDVAGLPVPRDIRGAGPVAGHEGGWGVVPGKGGAR